MLCLKFLICPGLAWELQAFDNNVADNHSNYLVSREFPVTESRDTSGYDPEHPDHNQLEKIISQIGHTENQNQSLFWQAQAQKPNEYRMDENSLKFFSATRCRLLN